MKMALPFNHNLLASMSAAIMIGLLPVSANATAPCGDFGECKVLIEINATDGDIGFHFLKDGDDLLKTVLKDPKGRKVFQDKAKGPLAKQKFTEIFGESAEPLCWFDPEADPDDLVVLLEDFIARWKAGAYRFFGKGKGGERLKGQTDLSHELPAAPIDVSYNDATGEVTWASGMDLGECASEGELWTLVDQGVLPMHPANVPVAQWEVVVEVEASPVRTFTVQLLPGQTSVQVPGEFLDQFGDDTLGKVEVGAIGMDDNATFTEEEICINEDEGCGDD